MLDKVEREWRAEAGFRREATPRFVVKYRDTLDAVARREIVAHLEAAAARVSLTLAYAPQQRTTVVLYEHHEFRSVTRVHAWATGPGSSRCASCWLDSAPARPWPRRCRASTVSG